MKNLFMDLDFPHGFKKDHTVKKSRGYIVRGYFISSACCIAMLAVLMMPGLLKAQDDLSRKLIPENITIEQGYEPGYDPPVGSAVTLEGDVIVIHEHSKIGYRLKRYLPVFKKDTIITLSTGTVSLKLKDGSIVALSSRTRFVIERNIFEKDTGMFSSFMNMVRGKARFVIRKIKQLKGNECKIKTKTAVIGLRGSDFIIAADDERTKVSALDKTRLEVSARIFTETGEIPGPSVFINEYEHVEIRKNQPDMAVIKLKAVEIMNLKEEFDRIHFTPVSDGSQASNIPQQMSTPGKQPGEQLDQTTVRTDYIVAPEKLIMPPPVIAVSEIEVISPEDKEAVKNADKKREQNQYTTAIARDDITEISTQVREDIRPLSLPEPPD